MTYLNDWETVDKIKKGSTIAIFKKKDPEHDLVLYTTVKKVLEHVPFSDLYIFLSTSDKVYKVKKRKQ